ncbi:MAG: serine/threonine-protein kinase, partial [Actinomycetota bacterium]|nr:serine/threonine-protein kinase [Actinomycetota bacterium]
MVANDATPPTRIIAGRFRLGQRLGSGLEAAVFDAFDEQLQRMVVLKLVHPDLSDLPTLQRQFREVMPVAVAFHHPNVAVVHDWGKARWNDRDVLYVATERLAGGSLRDILDRGRLLSPSQALVVGLDACKALDALHRQGLVHADVRPSTLVFGEDRRLRLVDAGLAQVLQVTAEGVGSRSIDRAKYCSPEQAVDQPVSPKSDVYSLCLSLLEAVTGAVPFVGDSTVATLANRVDKLMPVSADLGPLAAVLERAGRPLAGDRYTAAEFGRALVQAAEKLPRPAPLPILSNSLFGPDPGGPDQPVEPTGPLRRPPLDPTAGPDVATVLAAPVVATDLAAPVVVAPVVAAPVVDGADDSPVLPPAAAPAEPEAPAEPAEPEAPAPAAEQAPAGEAPLLPPPPPPPPTPSPPADAPPATATPVAPPAA